MGKYSNECPVSAAVSRLVHKSFDEAVSAEELLQIQQALDASEAARSWYLRVAQLHADLSSTTQSLDVCRQAALESEEPEQDVDRPRIGSSITRGSQAVRDFAHQFPLGLAASLLVLGLGLGCTMGLFAATLVYVAPQFSVAPWNWVVGENVLAKVVSSSDVEWQSSETPETLPTQGLRAGQQIRIKQGLLHLRYRSGVDLILAGPAVYEVRSEHAGKLYAGRLTAVCASDAATFNIQTPFGLLQVGPGHYGLELTGDEMGAANSQELSVHVLSGMSVGEPIARFTTVAGEATKLVPGDAVRLGYGTELEYVPLATAEYFPPRALTASREKFQGQTILLGNLFDDSKTASLTEAMATDSYQAAGETIDLGVVTVHDGGLDVDVALAEDGVMFNFANVGGGGARVNGLPGNDAYRSSRSIPIRTSGKDFPVPSPRQKVEEGIGMCTNELLTFDLDELRRAGELGNTAMRFVADRAGINDRDDEDLRAPYRNLAKVHTVAVLSTADRVVAAYLNGVQCDVVERGGVFSVAHSNEALPAPLRYNGKFADYDIAIPAETRFLTLATLMVGKEDCDHAVFSGARLELVPGTDSIANQVAN